MTYTIYQIFNSLGNLKRPHGFVSIDANFSCITEEDIINASKDTILGLIAKDTLVYKQPFSYS